VRPDDHLLRLARADPPAPTEGARAAPGAKAAGPFLRLDPPAAPAEEPAAPEPFFEEPPFPVGFAAAAARDPPPRRPPAGVLGSLGIHLLPLVLLVSWSTRPAEPPPSIPVQLVLEKPKPAPAPGEKQPPPGRLASVSMGERAAVSAPARAPAPAAAAPPARPQRVVLPPPDKPAPPPRLAAPPKLSPVPNKTAAAVLRPHKGQVLGPAATRDEYLAYLVTLTRRHFDMLPLSFIAGRSGETVLSVRVLGDGTIAQIAVAHGSGYPDIDARIEKMVASIRRFPPLPQWYQGNSMDLDMRLRFPEALELPPS
jgi:periplasmic protein TonB